MSAYVETADIIHFNQHQFPLERVTTSVNHPEQSMTLSLMEAGLRKHISRYFPHYIKMSNFVFLNNLPLTDNGKIDRKLLNQMMSKFISRVFQAPTTPMESKLCHIFKSVLNMGNMGTLDDLHSLGCDSIQVLKIIHQIEHTTKQKGVLSISQIYQLSNVKSIAQFLDSLTKSHVSPIIISMDKHRDSDKNNIEIHFINQDFLDLFSRILPFFLPVYM